VVATKNCLAALAVVLIAAGALSAAPTGARAGSYWANCGYTLAYQEITTIAHRVNCVKARRVLRKTYSKGQESTNGYVRVKSFTCSIRPNAYRMVECRHGAHRILGPLPS
jgi:hypothetical protein